MASSLHSRTVQGRELRSDRGTLGFSIMCGHGAVALQAHAVPDAVAIIGGDKKLTYSETNARANHLANLLRSRGIKAQVPVALFSGTLSRVGNGRPGCVEGGRRLRAGGSDLSHDSTGDAAGGLCSAAGVDSTRYCGTNACGKVATIVLDENIPFRMNRPANRHTCLSAERLRTRTIGL
jgi:hypothetical protein